jgi:hypothetical protein
MAPRAPETIALVERHCDAAGVVLISEATALAIDDAHRRAELGLRISERELADIRYAIAAASPQTKNFGGPTLELLPPGQSPLWQTGE